MEAVDGTSGNSTRRLYVALIVAAFLVGAYYVGVKGSRRSAFNRWQPQIAALWKGEDVYYRYGFPTPPIMAVVLTPFVALPAPYDMAAWFAFKCLLTFVAIHAASRMAERSSGGGPAAWMVGGAILLAAAPLVGDLLHGNVNLWILFLLVASAAAWQAKRDWTCGLLLSLATACKVTPALAIVYLGWKRSWRALGACAVGLILWLFIVPGLLLGHARNRELLAHWSDMMVRPYVERGVVESDSVNQSLPGLLTRWLGAPRDEDAPRWQAPAAVSASLRWTIRVANLVVVGALLAACRRRLPQRTAPQFLFEWSLVLLCMLALSERSWKHHYVTLLPVYLFLLAASKNRVLRPTIGIAVVVSSLAMLLAAKDVGGLAFGEEFSERWQACGAYLWALAALAWACAACLRSTAAVSLNSTDAVRRNVDCDAPRNEVVPAWS